MKSKTAIIALTITVASAGYSLFAAGNAFAQDQQAEDPASAAMLSADAQPNIILVAEPTTWEGTPMLRSQSERPSMPPPMCAMRHEHMKAFMADLNLTDAQIEKLAQLESDFRDKAEPIKVKLHSLRRQCHRLLLTEQIDPAAIAKIHTQMEAQQKVLDGYMTDYLISKAEVLTPEQRHKIELAMDKREMWHHGHHHHDGGFRGDWS